MAVLATARFAMDRTDDAGRGNAAFCARRHACVERPIFKYPSRHQLESTIMNAVICAYARSPFTPANKGALVEVRPDDLAAQVVRGLLVKTSLNPAEIEDVICGCAFPTRKYIRIKTSS